MGSIAGLAFPDEQLKRAGQRLNRKDNRTSQTSMASLEQIGTQRTLPAAAKTFFFALHVSKGSLGSLKKKLLRHSPCLGLPRTTATKPPKQNVANKYILGGLVLVS